MRTLRLCLFASFFKALCKLVSFKSYGVSTGFVHVTTIVVFIMRVQAYLAKTLLSKNAVGNTSNNFTFPQSSGKRSLHLIQKLNQPFVRNIARVTSSLWMSMRRSWMVESQSLMLVSWQNGISPSNFLWHLSFGVISIAESLYNRHLKSGHLTRKSYGYFRCPGNNINAVSMWFVFCGMIWYLSMAVPE